MQQQEYVNLSEPLVDNVCIAQYEWLKKEETQTADRQWQAKPLDH